MQASGGIEKGFHQEVDLGAAVHLSLQTPPIMAGVGRLSIRAIPGIPIEQLTVGVALLDYDVEARDVVEDTPGQAA